MAKNSIISQRLKELREQYTGLKQADFAAKINMDLPRWSTYETGRTPPPLSVLIDLANIFGVSVDWILGLSDKSLLAPKTYSDVIQSLFDIESAGVSFALDAHCDEESGNAYSIIGFTGLPMLEFIDSWKKIRSALSGADIDENDELYELWKERAKQKFNVEVNKE